MTIAVHVLSHVLRALEQDPPEGGAASGADSSTGVNACSDDSLAVGGQAVMEGIMMRNGNVLALAVRKPDQSIAATSLPWFTLSQSKIIRKRGIRGFPVLIETMFNGIKALNLSAEIAAEAEGDPIKPWQMVLTLVVSVGLALLLFVVAPHLLTIGLNALSLSGGVEGLSFHLWDGLLKFLMFVSYIGAISFVPDIRRVFEYHGAEHKSIAAYEQGEDPVTPDSAKKYSRLHPRCGTTFLLFVLSISIILHAVTVPLLMLGWTPSNAIAKHAGIICFKLLLTIPISALAYEAIRSTARMTNSLLRAIVCGPGLFLQFLTTREPDEGQLQIGLVALKEALGDSATASIETPVYERFGHGALKQEQGT